jgi:hypothetical protein
MINLMRGPGIYMSLESSAEQVGFEMRTKRKGRPDGSYHFL